MEKDKGKKAGFDIRLFSEQREFFEKAAILGGYKNLTDFVIQTIQEKADEIIAKQAKSLVLQDDSEIFSEAIIDPQEPDAELLEAKEEFGKYRIKEEQRKHRLKED